MTERPLAAWTRLLAALMGIALLIWAGAVFTAANRPLAVVEPVEGGIAFRLRGAPTGVTPHLKVYSDKDLADFLRPLSGDEGYWLPNLALSNFPAVMLTWVWELGDARLSGDYLFVNREYPYSWRLRRIGHLHVYYADGAVHRQIDRWADLNDWVPQFLGVNQERVVVYVMPDDEAYSRIVRGRSHLNDAAAFYMGTRGWIVLRPGQDETVLAHELGHAYLWSRNPAWWEEGVATWIEAHAHARQSRKAWQNWRGQLDSLFALASHRPIAIHEATYDAKSPEDPYLVGLSFVLDLERRFGTEQVRRLVVLARTEDLPRAVEMVLGADLATLIDQWQTTLANGELARWLEERP